MPSIRNACVLSVLLLPGGRGASGPAGVLDRDEHLQGLKLYSETFPGGRKLWAVDPLGLREPGDGSLRVSGEATGDGRLWISIATGGLSEYVTTILLQRDAAGVTQASGAVSFSYDGHVEGGAPSSGYLEAVTGTIFISSREWLTQRPLCVHYTLHGARAGEPQTVQGDVRLGAAAGDTRALMGEAEKAADERDWDLAADKLAQVISFEPANAEALRLLSDALSMSDRLEEARAAIDLALSLAPGDAWSHFQRGWLLGELAGRSPEGLAQAIACYDEAVELDPEDAEVYMHRGEARRELKAPGPAAEDFLAAARLLAAESPRLLEALERRSACLAEVGEPTAALEANEALRRILAGP